MAFLVIAGFAYFSQYYDHSFNYGDEGKMLLITMRLLEGDRPYLDIELSYGLLWYYPLGLLFKITGVDFIAARIYFLSLALVTSLLAFLTIRRQTHCRSLAIAVALLMLLVPGTLHKTYIPLIIVANMLAMSYLDGPLLNRGRVFVAALVAGVSWHIRPELGLCTSFILIATLVFRTISRSPGWRPAARDLGRLFMPVGAAHLVPTLPLMLIAYRQGFLAPFVSTTLEPIDLVFLRNIMSLMFTGSWNNPGLELPAQAGETLSRIPLASVWEGGPSRDLAVLTYLPLMTFAMVILLACLHRIRRRQERSMVGNDTVKLLALLGLAYSAFPQFFLFRPEANHLSQFMPGYLVFVGVCLGRWLAPVHLEVAGGSDAGGSHRNLRRLDVSLPSSYLILHVCFYVWFGLHQQGTGSIALAHGRTERFLGAHGIDVAVTPAEKNLLETVTRIVKENTDQDDAMLCFPYCPGFNVMTERRTFAQKLYVDDSQLISDPGWQRRMIERIKTENPPLIIIDDWAINRTQISRFEKWAKELMCHITSNYVLLEDFGRLGFYVREDARVPALDSPVKVDLVLDSSGAQHSVCALSMAPWIAA